MRDQNYTTVPEYQPWPRHDPGWCLLEWDIALDRHGRDRFAAGALEHPDRVRVAPYLLYPPEGPRQVHRLHGTPLADGQPHADMFGFGCIYLPQTVLDAFWSDPPRRLTRTGVLTDTVFSDWHRSRFGPVDVDWNVHPQHLHGD